MTREEAVERLKNSTMRDTLSDQWKEAYKMAIQALSQEPCDDAISREWLMRKATERFYTTNYFNHISAMIEEAPSVMQKSGKCKNCKYFEYDSVAKVDGIPFIVAHEICNKWGNGCKTSEDGYCYLFEPQENEEISDRNMKMWEEIFKAEMESKEE